MALVLAPPNVGIYQSTNIIAGTHDYTCCFWLNLRDIPVLGQYRTIFEQGDDPIINTVGIYTQQNNIYIYSVNGGTAVSSTFQTLDPTTWYFVAYSRTGSTHKFYINNTLVDTIVNAAVITGAYTYISSGYALFQTNYNIGLFREWDVQLTASQIANEGASGVPVVTSGLKVDTTLQNNLLDNTSNHNNWIADGITESYVANPLFGNLKHNEVSIGKWFRSSQFYTMPANITSKFLEVEIGGTIVAYINAKFITAGGGGTGFATPSNSVFEFSLYHREGAALVATAGINNIFTDPAAGIGVYFPTASKSPRLAWVAGASPHVHTIGIRIRTNSINISNGTYPGSNGEIEVQLDGVAVWNLTGLNLNVFSSTGTARLKFGCQGDVTNCWILNANELPALNADGTFVSDPESLIKFEDWSDAVLAPNWGAWNSSPAGNATPYFLIDGGPSDITAISYTTISPHIGYVSGAPSGRAGSGVQSKLGSEGGTIPPIGVVTDSTSPDIPPSTTGTIVVTKVVQPDTASQSFTFTTSGGLSPTSFELIGGGVQQFNDVPAGSGYSIVETLIPGYTTSYEVSNGDLNTNLTVVAGETISITVLNQIAGGFSGIYFIHRDKTNDTLWLDNGQTIDVKIP